MAKVKFIKDSGENQTYSHHCPACGHIHLINTGKRCKPRWTFRGTIDNPSFHPSIKITAPGYCCHYWITNGQIIFERDSLHSLSGKTVPLPDIP